MSEEKKVLIEKIKKIFDESEEFDTPRAKYSYDDLRRFSQRLEEEGIINYTIEDREDSSDKWMQIEYTDERLNKPVIFDYDATDIFDDVDDLFGYLADVELDIIEFTKKTESKDRENLKKCLYLLVQIDSETETKCEQWRSSANIIMEANDFYKTLEGDAELDSIVGGYSI